MAVTNEQVRAFLDRDEPDYAAGATMGPEALPILRRFVEGDDPNRAAKAASLAGRIAHPDAAPILGLAARSTHAGVRAAAAHAVRYVGEAAEPVLVQLVDDDNPAVRKTALKSIPERPGKELLAKVGILQRDEANPMVREIASDVFNRAAKPSPGEA